MPEYSISKEVETWGFFSTSVISKAQSLELDRHDLKYH